MNRRAQFVFSIGGLILIGVLGACSDVHAADEVEPVFADPHFALPNATVPSDERSNGVLQESFQYHRQGFGDTRWTGLHTQQTVAAPAGGWYGYGFPVQTYRWGWFGASRYYPRVVWHRGYYDDCCRWAYRRGY